jgi:hypothetical protein
METIRQEGFYWVRVKDTPDEWVVAYWFVNPAAKHIFGFITKQPDNREILEVDEKQIIRTV